MAVTDENTTSVPEQSPRAEPDQQQVEGTTPRRHSLAKSQDAYDRFSSAVDGPLMVITLLWLPVLIIPLIKPVHGAVAETFATIDYTVWALFAVEYLTKLYLAPNEASLGPPRTTHR